MTQINYKNTQFKFPDFNQGNKIDTSRISYIGNKNIGFYNNNNDQYVNASNSYVNPYNFYQLDTKYSFANTPKIGQLKDPSQTFQQEQAKANAEHNKTVNLITGIANSAADITKGIASFQSKSNGGIFNRFGEAGGIEVPKNNILKYTANNDQNYKIKMDNNYSLKGYTATENSQLGNTQYYDQTKNSFYTGESSGQEIMNQSMKDTQDFSQKMKDEHNFIKDEYNPQDKVSNKNNKNLNGQIGSMVQSIAPVFYGLSSYLKEDYKNPNDVIGFTGENAVNWAREGCKLNKYADAGAIGNAIQTAGSLAGNALNAAKLDNDPNAVNKSIDAGSQKITTKEFQSGANTYDQLMQDFDKSMNYDHLNLVDHDTFNQDTTGSVIMNSIGAGLQGSGAGLDVGGPWGAITGGVIGTVSSLFGSIEKAKKAAKATDETNKHIDRINRQVDYVNNYNQRGFDNAFNNIATQIAENEMRNFASEGAEFNIKPIKNDNITKVQSTRFEPIITNTNRNGKYGTSYKEGGVYDLDNKTITKLLAEGYIIERV